MSTLSLYIESTDYDYTKYYNAKILLHENYQIYGSNLPNSETLKNNLSSLLQ